jgi:hypothetical protein
MGGEHGVPSNFQQLAPVSTVMLFADESMLAPSDLPAE